MSFRKKWLAALLAAVLAVSVAAGLWYYETHYVMVDFQFYPRVERLDLRGREISVRHYEKLQKSLPECEIFWDVPLSERSWPNDAREIEVKFLTDADIFAMDHLTQLEKVDAAQCTDYAQLLALRDWRKEVEVQFDIVLGGQRYDPEAEQVELKQVPPEQLARLDYLENLTTVVCAGGDGGAMREYCREKGLTFAIRFGDRIVSEDTRELEAEGVTDEQLTLLPLLPELKAFHIRQPQAPAGSLIALAQSMKEVDITWEKTIWGVPFANDAEGEIDLSQAEPGELEEIGAGAAYLPEVDTVFLGKCGLDNQVLAEYREAHRKDFKLVWTVELGKKLSARTDDKTFMPVREHVYYFNDKEAYNLRYCEEMTCIDIGHMSIHNIDFVEFMPNLTYLILAHTQVSYIEPIAGCKNLKFLELDWSPIRDLSPLVGCTGLEDLNLGKTYASFEPVKQMTWLKNLWVINCNRGVAYQMSQALPDTKVQGAGEATVDSGWRNLPNYYAMRDQLGMFYMSW